MSQVLFTVLVLAVGVERLYEVRLSERNTAWALDRGGVETGQGHYPVMVVLHTGLLAGCLVEVWALHRPFVPLLGWTMLAVLAATMAVRWWCIRALGSHWNTRVVVVPGMTVVRTGPYRFFAHPNYAVVVVEGAALPLVHTAWLTALVFGVADLALLSVRVRAEERALAGVAEAVAR